MTSGGSKGNIGKNWVKGSAKFALKLLTIVAKLSIFNVYGVPSCLSVPLNYMHEDIKNCQ